MDAELTFKSDGNATLEKTYKSTIYLERGCWGTPWRIPRAFTVYDSYINTDVGNMGPTSSNRWSYLPHKRLRGNVCLCYTRTLLDVWRADVAEESLRLKILNHFLGVLMAATWNEDKDAYSPRKLGPCARQFNKHVTERQQTPGSHIKPTESESNQLNQKSALLQITSPPHDSDWDIPRTISDAQGKLKTNGL